MTRLVPVSDIVAGLAHRIEPLVAELLPHGRREGAEWRVGSVAGEPGRSMAVHLAYGPKRGVWADFSSGESGDALDLVGAVLFRGDKKQAVRWALSWLGLEAGAVPERAPPAPRAPDQTLNQHKAAAFRIWLGASPWLHGTPAERYLQARGINLDALGHCPGALRFHPALLNLESGRKWPALVAKIDRGPEAVAIHRTWLTEDGQKAPLADPKMTLGSYKGGLIPLWRGASGRALKDALPNEAIILSEGIEDGLSCALERPQYRVAAAVSLSNMGALELPPAIRTIIIASQNDPWWYEKQSREHGALRGLDRAIRHFQKQGRTVRLARPSTGKDMNDLLRGNA